MKKFKHLSNFIFLLLAFFPASIVFFLTKAKSFFSKFKLLELIYIILIGLCYQCIIFARLLSLSLDFKPIITQMDEDLTLFKKK